ncbi:MAG TPA: anaerobic ribonucleoside-triphosphate reductase activating protein [Fibrobacteria bacterium]|nr:anaerobic ribonucleoside-triphosphate reductase activating protein [Fibrobacteria bacterium]
MVPFSTVDYPGKFAAVVFCQGCPWRCEFCHNPHLLPFQPAEARGWDSVQALLERRQGLLDAVVFSGGEPTAQADLPACAREARGMGYAVGLHTGGAFPERFQEVLPWIDWVGLDIKTNFEEYHRVTGAPASGDRALQCLRLLLDSGTAFECRTTLNPRMLTLDTVFELGRTLAGLGVRHYAVQAFRSEGCADASLAALPEIRPSAEWLRRMGSLFEGFAYRGE